VVEDFMDKSKRELAGLEKQKKGRGWSEVSRPYMLERIEDLKRILPAIDAYKKQVVKIGPDAVPLRDVVVKFEDLMLKYQETMRKQMAQREDAEGRWARLQGQVDVLRSMFDPETGEYKGMPPEEIQNIKDVFFRLLYKYMDSYWSTRVGKNIAVFGERDTTWYDNVYRTFRSLSKVRSNRKLMSLLQGYKESTQSEFPKDASRRPSRIKALQERLASIYQGYKDQGIDPVSRPEYRELSDRLQGLQAQRGQIGQIFDKMSATVEAAIHDGVADTIRDKITGDKPPEDTGLEKKVDEGVKETVSMVEAELPEVVQSELALKQMEYAVGSMEKRLGIEAPVAPSEAPVTSETPKTAYDKTHPDFDLKILYGSHMQEAMAKMLV
jgi:hypothetical protein